jgi:hypothetical protein
MIENNDRKTELYIRENFSRIIPYAPAGLPIASKFEDLMGDWYANFPVSPEPFVHSRRGPKFAADDSIPDGYICYGIQNASSSEYLFVMMRRGSRRFWFYDQSCCFMSGPEENIHSECEINLGTALDQWEAEDGNVLYRFGSRMGNEDL